MMTTLTVNGEPFSLSGRTVADLVQALNLSGRRLAVEVNRDIVPKSAHADHVLRDGDVVEIVHAIGGG
ncbi:MULTISPECIES: sulfur carrier protein ThiS [Alloalcanivorax]|jgi:sulfur carrier protein|uniref:Sulfur carrier protein ThiS n=2 Tax=Alloalcanivorax TaxID=3020832 RepID=A0A9Q3W8D3_9GAMM|nr:MULTISPECIES: sulfur carrier protein ThiS [Alloalcanivorax]ERS10803.1 thiamin biosynthesis sulfur carrier protein [Alcanivorax sp. PN-3]KYZ86983.1 thiamine biosynthesis protein ThiS [Alcanivorax sp. KX64203]MBA4722684.1 sulfur carrier protein ThiS [Alcanivorax sp.]ARB44180.1 thiamin biosynthesis protein [Alloalcanivorax xenomutans]MCE7511121.1 sulfur carrier protein ThiS [Alloalcanivorax xenomutans]|tara:strand:+ start:296 stop:499 length:204 start_codon:yes stop_codon:yes gene_type:complete